MICDLVRLPYELANELAWLVSKARGLLDSDFISREADDPLWPDEGPQEPRHEQLSLF